MNNRDVTFKVDTGTDVTVFPPGLYDATTLAELEPRISYLLGAGHAPFSTIGKFSVGGRTTREII